MILFKFMYKNAENHALPKPKQIIEKVFEIWECIKVRKIMYSQNQKNDKKILFKLVLGVHKNEKIYALPIGNWECKEVQKVHRSV